MKIEEYIVTLADCSDKTKKGKIANEIARSFKGKIVHIGDKITLESLLQWVKDELVSKTASCKGAEIEVRLNKYGENVWIEFVKNGNVGGIHLQKIKGHIEEL